ncbi:MAG: alpha-amylase C-terminal beta-sheet domain-containing protein [Gemmataceae bacterium]
MHTAYKHPITIIVPVRQAPETDRLYHGDGRDIFLQGFHWESHLGATYHNGSRRAWYRVLTENADTIKRAGFSWVWFPPCSDSFAPQGYMPRRWYQLNTPYGSEGELREAIQALKPVKAMADVVVNHRVGVATSGADFEDPAFPDNRAAIVRDDDSGVGTGNPDTGNGEYFGAGRELDHTNGDVRHAVKHYLHRLKSLGFRGWRYDLVKGYHGRYVAEYNDASQPEFSIGEYYDGDRQQVTNWIDDTHGKSTAFDFPLRYLLYDACKRDDYGVLRSHNQGRTVPAGLIGFWPSRAVTFIDNHDTEYRRDREHECHYNDTRHFAGKSVALGYAYILTHPGNPCVFWSHYFDWDEYTRQRIDALIKVRKQAGLHARSNVEIREAGHGIYSAIIDDRVAVKLGARGWHPGGSWQLAVDGEKFAVWMR